jgi:hypothetical protein
MPECFTTVKTRVQESGAEDTHYSVSSKEIPETQRATKHLANNNELATAEDGWGWI